MVDSLPGMAADLVAFDPATVGVAPLERVHDLPAGADRLVAWSRGIHHVWVNGTPIVSEGADVPAQPGKVLRSTSTRRVRCERSRGAVAQGGHR